jgi:hypothetical protein
MQDLPRLKLSIQSPRYLELSEEPIHLLTKPLFDLLKYSPHILNPDLCLLLQQLNIPRLFSNHYPYKVIDSAGKIAQGL